VNNAETRIEATLEDTVPHDWKRVLDVNLFGAFLGLRAVAETLRHSGGGSIVNIASRDALVGAAGVAAYASSKWGLRGLTKCAALEFGEFGVRVNTVCADAGERSREAVAARVAFLISDDASGITGADVLADAPQTSGRSTS
jgi:3alpha(or 20beta)-hydroxysteroid dehydrogenase